MIEDSYKNTNSPAFWLIDGKKTTYIVNTMLTGWVLERSDLIKWKSYIKVRDNFTCQKCSSRCKIQAHHILPWQNYLNHRFNIHNGISLCKDCHMEYHGLFKFKETPENFSQWSGILLEDIMKRFNLPILDSRSTFELQNLFINYHLQNEI